MHIFEPKISLKENWQKADELTFAAWICATEEQREEYRDSGHSRQRNTALQNMHIRCFSEQLSAGYLIALGVQSDDPELEVRLVPSTIFAASDMKIDADNAALDALGRKFLDVKICRQNTDAPELPRLRSIQGRPSHLPLILKAWNVLKSEKPSFLDYSKTNQNLDIQRKISVLFPDKFPSITSLNVSTIRRHRSKHANLFT